MQQLRMVLVMAVVAGACTLHHSKVAIPDQRPVQIAPDAKFVTSDDSGLALLSLFVVSEPDHYAVLLERIRRRYNCAEVHHAQLDFYSDIWLFVSFPIARVTAICDQQPAPSMPTPPTPPTPPAPAQTPAAPASSPTPTPAPPPPAPGPPTPPLPRT